VSDRGLAIADGAHACPFVAFEEDRDERADVPDHRHRCYADSPPAPRALAHQEAYCLSGSFPVCPTFQDWARREAARSRGGESATPPAAVVAAAPDPDPGVVEPEAPSRAEPAPVAGPIDDDNDDDAPPPPAPYDTGGARRNPPRDWAAPPPWLASAEGGAPRAPADPPSFLASRSQPGQGLAGSTADLWAGGEPPRSSTSPPVDPAAAAAAAATAAAAAGAASRPAAPAPAYNDHDDHDDDHAAATPPPASSGRPRAYNQHLGGPSTGPDWEKPRRYEAYPTIKTRVGLPAIPRLGIMAAAIGIAALALFFLPALLGFGSPDSPTATASPTPAPSRSIATTPTPAPTPSVYVIRAGDTLSKIATEFGLTLDQLLAANPDITDPNRITEGQQIIIPAPSQAPQVIGGSAAPSGSAAP
jgi:hypothetical protein